MRGVKPGCRWRGDFTQETPDGADQSFVVQWLSEKSDRTRIQRLLFELHRIASRDDDDRDVLAFVHPTNPIHDEKSVPRHSAAVGHVRRETEIEQNEIRPVFADGADSVRTIKGCEHIVAGSLQFEGERLDDERVVVYDE